VGKQVNFYMLPPDEREFLDSAFADEQVEVLSRDGETIDPAGVQASSAAEAKEHRYLLLHRRGEPLRYREAIMTDGPRRGQSRLYVDSSRSNVIELSRSWLDMDNERLHRGRLWAEMRRLEDDRFVHKGVEFERWYDSLARWIRRHCHRILVPEMLGEYAGPEAYEWFRSRGTLA